MKATRRAFLAAAASLPLAGDDGPAGVMAGVIAGVIDVATHFYDTRRPQGVPWPSPKSPVLYKPSLPDRYLAAVKPYRVDGVVAIEASPWLEDNLWLLTLGEKTPLIRGVVGHLDPGHPDFRAALERFSKHPLWRGIRINGADIPKIMEDRQKMADLHLLMEKGLSLDVLIGQPSYADIAGLSGALPDLRIIVGHLPLDDSRGMKALAGRGNIVAKVSGVVRPGGSAASYKPRLDELWDVFGPDRVLYASNWPTCDMVALYPEVYRTVIDYLAGKPARVTEKFFRENATAVYRLA